MRARLSAGGRFPANLDEADEGTRTLDLLHGNPPRHAEVGSAGAWLSQIAAGR